MIEIYNDKLTEQPVMNCGELVRETVICDISGKRFAGYDFGPTENQRIPILIRTGSIRIASGKKGFADMMCSAATAWMR